MLILLEMEIFTYAMQININMSYFTIRLDGGAPKICEIIFPWSNIPANGQYRVNIPLISTEVRQEEGWT